MKKRLKYLFRKLFSGTIKEIITENVVNGSMQRSLTVYSNENLISGLVKLYPPYSISNTSIDKYTYISQNSSISFTSIGKFCSIGPNFLCGWGIHPADALSTSPMFYSTLKQNGYTFSNTDKVEERKNIRIGNDVFIGANVIVLDGVTIGDGAIIGAGTVVSKNVPDYAIFVGSPMKVLRYRFEPEVIKELLSIKWWEFEEDDLKKVEEYLFKVEAFIEEYKNA